jgi:hypothetical protein
MRTEQLPNAEQIDIQWLGFALPLEDVLEQMGANAILFGKIACEERLEAIYVLLARVIPSFDCGARPVRPPVVVFAAPAHRRDLRRFSQPVLVVLPEQLVQLRVLLRARQGCDSGDKSDQAHIAAV